MQMPRNRPNPTAVADWLPALLFTAYVLLSYPMMYPGLDVYIHLVRIDAGTNGSWAEFWHHVFGVLQIEHALTQALIIHRVQTAAAGLLLYAAADRLLRLAFAQSAAAAPLIRPAAWLSVLVWALMHGTASRPINSPLRVWQAWLQWYSVNYQIALPLAVFATAALLYGVLAPAVSRRLRAAHLAAAVPAALAVAVIHAAELPYILFALLLAGVVFFRRTWWRNYLVALGVGMLLLLFGLTQSYRLPHGLIVLQEGGVTALRDEMRTVGRQLVTGLNRGNAGWNLWFWANLAMAAAAWRLLGPQLSAARRLLIFVVLSAVPAAALYSEWTAGLPAMLTYPRLAWRFVFASFLFVAPALLLIPVALRARPPQRAPLVLTGLFGVLLAAVLLASYTYEPERVSLRYAKSMLLALNPAAMSFHMQPQQEAWLDELQIRLAAQPPQQPICTDMATAYRLYFDRGYRAVALPERLTDDMRPPRPPDDCAFPRDGGAVVRQLGMTPLPWDR